MISSRIQIIPSLAYLPTASKLQGCAFIRSESCFIVWNSEIEKVVGDLERWQGILVKEVFAGKIGSGGMGSRQADDDSEEDDTKTVNWEGSGDYNGSKNGLPEYGAHSTNSKGGNRSGSSENLRQIVTSSPSSSDGTATSKKRRPFIFIWPVISTLAIATTIIFFGFGVALLVKESMLDGKWIRMALLSLLPLQVLFTQFVPQAAIACLMQIFGPIKQIESNSQFYSGVPPDRSNIIGAGSSDPYSLMSPAAASPTSPLFSPTKQKLLQEEYDSTPKFKLPHITIQMPVYTESLDTVILPTLRSLQKAIATYESQGGSASIFINEDGMQVIPELDAKKRVATYAELGGIGWVARPKHNSLKRDGKTKFQRRGRFKKASNMNFCLMVSRALEEKLDAHPHMEYDDALNRVIYELESQLGVNIWAQGDILMGDVILIVDCDTRVPRDCLLDAALEFMENPEVAILQHTAAPMLVTDNYFEKGIAFFTKIVYMSIQYCCASGETSPFVGHNAFLRWGAIKEVGFEEKGEKGIVKYWSESHVSEDFDMSLRLQIQGYMVRFVAYCGDGFQEGVSLSVYDEVMRWQKYAYGCSELVFHPLKWWLWKGPFTPLFLKFLGSNMNLYSKMNIIGYIGSYYAIGGAWVLTLANYFLVGYWDDELDKYYLPSFNVLFTTLIVFTFLSNVAFAVLRHRLKETTFLRAMWENITWIPFFAVFFSGLSFHVSLALVAHLIGYDMTWGSTAKELENSNFFKEVPKVLKGYKWMYLIFLALVIMMGVIGTGAGVIVEEWVIQGFTVILPASLVFGGHLLLPIALNPSLMTFSF
jgi:hypothetical protein